MGSQRSSGVNLSGFTTLLRSGYCGVYAWGPSLWVFRQWLFSVDATLWRKLWDCLWVGWHHLGCSRSSCAGALPCLQAAPPARRWAGAPGCQLRASCEEHPPSVQAPSALWRAQVHAHGARAGSFLAHAVVRTPRLCTGGAQREGAALASAPSSLVPSHLMPSHFPWDLILSPSPMCCNTCYLEQLRIWVLENTGWVCQIHHLCYCPSANENSAYAKSVQYLTLLASSPLS